ncbi:hypothetical protein J6590_038509 [Homalodisca vitripennis]|nr:hypothetical protein J6590_038509 [Homalodisca vitripennis]
MDVPKGRIRTRALHSWNPCYQVTCTSSVRTTRAGRGAAADRAAQAEMCGYDACRYQATMTIITHDLSAPPPEQWRWYLTVAGPRVCSWRWSGPSPGPGPGPTYRPPLLTIPHSNYPSRTFLHFVWHCTDYSSEATLFPH